MKKKQDKQGFVFKDYKIEYEKVFTAERILNKCNIKDVSAFNNIPGNTTIYLKMFREIAKKFQDDLFDNLVKITWLRSRFCYRGRHRTSVAGNGWALDRSYGVFMKRYVGLNNKTIFSTRNFANSVVTYFKDFFPNFEEGNPFEEKYEYPFKYMNLDCLLLVNIMPERMYLLKHGEKEKMDFMQFTDYVINYTKCYNEEHEDKHEFVFSHCTFCYVRHLKAGEIYKGRENKKVYKILSEKIHG